MPPTSLMPQVLLFVPVCVEVRVIVFDVLFVSVVVGRFALFPSRLIGLLSRLLHSGVHRIA